MTNTPKLPVNSVAALGFLLLSSCGQSEPSQAANTENLQEDATETTDAPRDSSTLPTSKIDFTDAYNSKTPVVEKVVPPCPWLSDGTAEAVIVSTFAEKSLKRVAASNTSCRWNKGGGFSVEAIARPASDAVPPSQQVYNLDNPPVLEPVSELGDSAVQLLDPTWKDLGFDSRPYALVFDHAEHQFTIMTTGVETGTEPLIAAAKEIVSRWPGDGIAEVASTPKEVTPTFNACEAYPAAALAKLYGMSGDMKTSEQTGLSSCQYKGWGNENGRVVVEISYRMDAFDPFFPKLAEYESQEGYSQTVLHNENTSDGPANRYTIDYGTRHIRMLVTHEKEKPSAATDTLIRNLIIRTAEQ